MKTQTTDSPIIEAAAKWLMEDDTAYADSPDDARRVARGMLAAAQLAALPHQGTPCAFDPFRTARCANYPKCYCGPPQEE